MMMKCSRNILFLQQLVFLASFIVATSKRHDKEHRRLLLISMDGFRWDFLNGRAKTPTFDFMKNNGVHATDGIKNVFITNTLPNHFSMVTGLYVENHGMMDNLMYDPETNDTYVPDFYDPGVANDPGWHKSIGEPIWISHQIQNQGRTGALMWMGGETDLMGISPTKFFRYAEDLDEIKEMEIVMDWLTDANEPADLVVVYFPQPDLDEHAYGSESIEVTRKIEHLDKAMGFLLRQLKEQGLSDHTDIIVTSDHGFTSTSLDHVIRIDDILDPAWYKSPSYLPGPAMAIFPTEGMVDTVYDKLKSFADKTGMFHVYKNRDIPERFHYKSHKRVPPIFATALLGYSFSTKDHLDSLDKLKGNHGYDNLYQDMRPFFVAYGPSFKEGFSVKTFDIVDIYPLMCHLKGIQPAPNNGSMKIVSNLLRHYPLDQSCGSLSSCDQHSRSDGDDVQRACLDRYKDEGAPQN